MGRIKTFNSWLFTMSYKIELPQGMLKNLWRLKNYCAGPPIVHQVYKAVGSYIEKQERKLGAKIEDIAEAIEEHDKQKDLPQ